MKFKTYLAIALLALGSVAAWAGATDLQFPPTTSGGHDFNHAPVGQTFIALASQIKAGLYIADQGSFTNWLATLYPGQIQPGSYPYAVAPSIRVNVKLIQGVETTGPVQDSRDLTLTAPFMGFVDVDYAALGVYLVPGSQYTLLMTDVSGQAYPNGVTGWVVPSVVDYSTGASLPPGAYADGLPILQGALVTNDAGIGDNAFHVMDTSAVVQPATCAGANSVITSVGRDFIVVNGGMNLADHVWYAPKAGTTFQGGTTTFLTGELVTYAGMLDPVAGCYATTMTLMPPASPVVMSGTLPNGQVGTSYATALSASGGLAPYAWSATGLPPGVTFSAGSFAGIPTSAGAYAVKVNLMDTIGSQTSATYNVTIASQTSGQNSCSKPKGTKSSQGKGTVTAVGSSYIMVKALRIDYAACTSMNYGGYATTPAVGDRVEWGGYVEPNGNVMAQTLTLN
ncbi:conserved exported hypothetical protein [Gammaproteobacteria bacterium]